MVTFAIKLAGFVIKVTTLRESTKAFCHDYIAEGPEDFAIDVTAEDIDRFKSDNDTFSDTETETLVLYKKIMERLFEVDCVLFHGSVVAVDGGAYMFIAKSGVGKTTHTRLWLKNVPGSYVLNGDKPIIKFLENGIFACGTPWQGKEHYGINEILPLKGVCVLERGEINSIKRVAFGDIIKNIIEQSMMPEGAGNNTIKYLNLVGKLSNIPLFQLSCNMEDEAAVVASRMMVGK